MWSGVGTLAVALGEGERLRNTACSDTFSTTIQKGQEESALAGVAFTRRGRRKRPLPTPHHPRPYAMQADPNGGPLLMVVCWGCPRVRQRHVSNVFPLAQESILSWVYELPEPGPTSQRVLYAAQS